MNIKNTFRISFSSLKKVILILFTICLGAPQLYALEGIYRGYIKSRSQSDVEVPLIISLTTAENVDTSNSVRASILGSFIIDQEGGPYSFSNITLDINNGRLDMKYKRIQNSTTTGIPSDFRFIGTFTSQDEISGNVLSGRRGNIGDFFVKKARDKSLSRSYKYQGLWHGTKKNLDGSIDRMVISLNSTANHRANPNNMDFDYTVGKIGFVKFNDGVEFGLTKVFIDYLTREIIMIHESSSGTSSFSLSAKISPDRAFENGTIESTHAGKIATFSVDLE
ncbi:MAG: hypothetical protein R3B45_03835 [Bdellovibrionota bacterium]